MDRLLITLPFPEVRMWTGRWRRRLARKAFVVSPRSLTFGVSSRRMILAQRSVHSCRREPIEAIGTRQQRADPCLVGDP